MASDDTIRDKKLNAILKENQEKHQHYHPEKFINMNILQVKKFLMKDNER